MGIVQIVIAEALMLKLPAVPTMTMHLSDKFLITNFPSLAA
jgi:hypothetical protein